MAYNPYPTASSGPMSAQQKKAVKGGLGSLANPNQGKGVRSSTTAFSKPAIRSAAPIVRPSEIDRQRGVVAAPTPAQIRAAQAQREEAQRVEAAQRALAEARVAQAQRDRERRELEAAQRAQAQARVNFAQARRDAEAMAEAERLSPTRSMFGEPVVPPSDTLEFYANRVEQQRKIAANAPLWEAIGFGPERESVLGGEAGRPERFTRDWVFGEQELRAAGEAAGENRWLPALGWGSLWAAGMFPGAGEVFQFGLRGVRGARAANRANRVAGNAAETVANTMPSGPPPTPPPTRTLPGWDDPMPGPPPMGPPEPSIASVQRHNERVAQRLLEHQQYEADRLVALRMLRDALEPSTTPALPLRSSLSRTNPLGDLRITSGTPEVTTGTRTTLRDFALPYERLVNPSARELAESTAAPFLDAGLLVRRGLRQNEIDSAARLFARTNDGRNIENVPRFEVDRAQRLAQEVAEDYRGSLFEHPNRLSVRGANPDLDLPSGAVPFRNLAMDWTYSTSPGIDELVYGDYVDELARALGRAPYRREAVDVQALNQLLEAINSGQVSSVLHPRGLQGLLDEGAIPSLFDVRATSAGPGASPAEIAERMNLRRVSESSLLGVPYNAPGPARPRYGYLEAPEGYSLPGSNEGFMNYGGVSDYGPIVADWSNDIRNRASYTVGDSLNQIVAGSNYRSIPRPLAGTTLQDLVLSGGPYARSERLPYVETQLFDGPTIDDLIGLRVAPQYFDETSRLLQSRGIDVPVSVLPEPRLGFPWEVRGNVLPFRSFR